MKRLKIEIAMKTAYKNNKRKDEKIIFIILDGLADKGEKTPLSEAKKPNLDYLASRGFCCLWQGAIAPKCYNPKSMSDVATLEILGYSWKDNPGRGFIEALGIGIKPKRNAIYLRGNFATVEKHGDRFKILDRRAGRDESYLKELSDLLKMKIEDVKISCYHTLGHRCVLELYGKGLDNNITDSDAEGEFAQKIKAISKKSEKTARILNIFSECAFEILSKSEFNKKRNKPANFILLRGAGKIKKVRKFKEKYNLKACAIAWHVVIKGISKYLGIDFIDVKGANASLTTNLEGKINAIKKAFYNYDFLLLHINGCDVAAHDKNFEAKKEFLEKIDNIIFGELRNMKKINLVVTSDHLTPVATGAHEFGSVPILFYSSERIFEDFEKRNEISKNFSESACKNTYVVKNPMDFALKLFGFR